MSYSRHPARRPARHHARRRAFTVIELLIVIGVLAILATIIGFAMVGVMNRTKATSTRVTLTSLKSLQAEFEKVAKGLTRQPAEAWVVDASGAFTKADATKIPPDRIDIWRDANPNDGPGSVTNPEPDPFPAPLGLMRRDAVDNSNKANAARYKAEAVFNTQRVMGLLQSAPEAKRALGQMPSNQLMADAVPVPVLTANAAGTADPPIVVDGWGNPIIFVPAGGLYNVTVGDVLRKVVATTPTSYDGPIQSKDKRPFWASAGPDGIFGFVDVNNNNTYDAGTDIAGGDDNLYSFED